tara:strand:+ start:1310 stop:1543 length:234 start_codon:yes stop_codon:yes gene_type:complete
LIRKKDEPTRTRDEKIAKQIFLISFLFNSKRHKKPIANMAAAKQYFEIDDRIGFSSNNNSIKMLLSEYEALNRSTNA